MSMNTGHGAGFTVGRWGATAVAVGGVMVALAAGCNEDPGGPDGEGGLGGAGGSGGSGGAAGGSGGTTGGSGGSSGGSGGSGGTTGGSDGLGGLGGLGGGTSTDGVWTIVELDGAVCADGSPYKFFVKRADVSAGLVVTLEPGGACWDYDTCGGDGTTRAANLEGLGDDHMTALPPPFGTDPDAIPWGLMFPHLGVSDSGVATASYDQVFLPYCTGDAFVGDFTATYEAPGGGDEIEIEHRGAANMELVSGWLSGEFAAPEHLLVVGSSAGGLGAAFHYARLRDAVAPERSSFLNDSGPIFPPGGPQDLARQAFVQFWHTEDLLAELDERLDAPPAQLLSDDSGHLMALLSAAFPEDRFLQTYFLSDLNNSHFNYAGFYPVTTGDDLQALWLEDTDVLVDMIETTDNWGYYLPGFRADNCSHAVALLPVDELDNPLYALTALAGNADGYLRTDLGDLDFADALDSVLAADGDLLRQRAADPMTDFTDEQETACLDVNN